MSIAATTNHWYFDHEIDSLLTYYFSTDKSIYNFWPILATGQDSRKDLEEMLREYFKQQVLAMSEGRTMPSKLVLPCNLGKSHWTLVYIDLTASGQKICYFDPMGSSIPSKIQNVLSSQESLSNLPIIDLKLNVQRDGYNCGPWAIEAARVLVSQPDTDAAKMAIGQICINDARAEQQLYLKTLPTRSITIKSKFFERCPERRTSFLAEVSAENNILKQELLTQYLDRGFKVNLDDESERLAAKLQQEELDVYIQEKLRKPLVGR